MIQKSKNNYQLLRALVILQTYVVRTYAKMKISDRIHQSNKIFIIIHLWFLTFCLLSTLPITSYFPSKNLKCASITSFVSTNILSTAKLVNWQLPYSTATNWVALQTFLVKVEISLSPWGLAAITAIGHTSFLDYVCI